MELLIVGIVVNGLAFKSVETREEKSLHLPTLSNLEVWLMAKEAVIPIPELNVD